MSDAGRAYQAVDPALRPLGLALRAVIRKSLPQAEETVKWDNPCYVVGKRKIAFVCEYRDHLNLGFFEGARLRSPLLEGTGKSMRHVTIRSAADIKERELGTLLRSAAEE